MANLIDKDALVAEIAKEKSSIEDRINSSTEDGYRRAKNMTYLNAQYLLCQRLESFINTLEVKEVDLDIMQRMGECPYRKVGCTMYEGKILECKGACSWVVDHLKLKELKAQKGEEV